ncbi:MAG TPA: DNA internalization-related competence protein ComEC/Rec2 [Firmicutes bacterium]|nr:DNA internalization-related competence protein ComEC/Rec2 [Bacillota bacterium]
MRRPFFCGAVLFALGIWLGDLLRHGRVPGPGAGMCAGWSPSPGIGALIILAMAALSCLAGTVTVIVPRFCFTRLPERAFGVTVLLLGLLAYEVASLRLDLWDRILPDGERITIRGVITGEPRVSGGYAQAPLRLEDGARVLLRWRPAGGAVGNGAKTGPREGWRWEGPRYGDVAVVRGRIVRPRPSLNPGEFNMRAYLARQGITRVVYLGDSAGPGVFQRVGRSGSLFVSMLSRLRDRLISAASAGLDRFQADILSMLLFGKAGSGSPVAGPEVESFSTIGVQHVFSVSGLHVTLVAAVTSSLCQYLRRGAVARAAIVALACTGYSVMSGGTPSSLRAAIMAIMACGPRGDPLNSLGLSALFLLVRNPYLLFDIGFQLSFATTYAIIFMVPLLTGLSQASCDPSGARNRGRSILIHMAATSLAAQAGSAPLVALYFGTVSPLAVVANLAIVPLVEAAVMTAMVSGFLGIVAPGLNLPINLGNSFILQGAIKVSSLLASLPGAQINVSVPAVAVAVYYWAFFILGPAHGHLAMFRVRRRAMATLALIISVVVAASFTARRLLDPPLRVVFAAVGQGDSILVIAPDGKTMLIDGGSGGGGDSWDAGDRVVVPLLRRYGIRTVDVVVLTHPHEDHVGGLVSVMRKVGARYVLDPGLPHPSQQYREFLELVEAGGAKYIRARRGTSIRLGRSASVTVLHPPPEVSPANGIYPAASLNDSSLVLRLEHGNVSFLFAGDIEAAGECLLLQGTLKKATVLKVAHHGSASSTSPAFIEAVDPKYSVISVGSNPFGHPSPGTIHRLERVGSKVFRTDLDGAVIMESDGRKIRVSAPRLKVGGMDETYSLSPSRRREGRRIPPMD